MIKFRRAVKKLRNGNMHNNTGIPSDVTIVKISQSWSIVNESDFKSFQSADIVY